MRLVCSECGYTFDSKKMVDVCPYCGAKHTLHREKTAEDLLNEVDDL